MENYFFAQIGGNAVESPNYRKTCQPNLVAGVHGESEGGGFLCRDTPDGVEVDFRFSWSAATGVVTHHVDLGTHNRTLRPYTHDEAIIALSPGGEIVTTTETTEPLPTLRPRDLHLSTNPDQTGYKSIFGCAL